MRTRTHLATLQAALDAGAPLEPTPVRGLLEALRALEARLAKVSRISDGYQAQLLALNQTLTDTNRQLAQALSEVKTLRGFIPICAKCKRVRDDHGYWDQVESYISKRSEAVFSHGVCPNCAQDMRREMGLAKPPPRLREAEGAWKARVEALLEPPEHRTHPLGRELEDLARIHQRLQARFDKITRISDGFQGQLKALNLALAEASRTDALTGLPNRRSMMERLDAELARAEREGTPTAVIMADVDHFKEINDSRGHEAGDRVLSALGDVLRTVLREYDFCARWGGEEFLFLLPNTTLEGALQAVQRIRDHLAEEPLDPRPTMSYGVAWRHAGEDRTSLLARADGALYAAKEGGRNRVVTAEGFPSTMDSGTP